MDRVTSVQEQSGRAARARVDLALASLFMAAGLGAVVLVHGGILGISPGVFACLGGGVMAALLAGIDGRFSYRQQIAMVLPVVLGQWLVLSYLGERPHAAVGYSLIALGLAGVLPALLSASTRAPARARRESGAPASDRGADAPALQTT